MDLRRAVERLVVLDDRNRGWNFHYTDCGIYYQGIITQAKPKSDPTYGCTCGRDEAIDTFLNSSIARHLADRLWAKDQEERKKFHEG